MRKLTGGGDDAVVAEGDVIRVGIIGGGVMGRRHADLVEADPGFELVAVCDPKSDALASERDVDSFTDERHLFQAGVDAVIIANPNTDHVASALTSLEYGVPALLEKPVSDTLDSARVLAAAVAVSGIPVLVGHHRRHHPSVGVARTLIAAGELGDIVAVNGMWLTVKPASYFEQEWRRQPGAGVVLINLVHDLDLLRFLIGEVVAVGAITSSAARALVVEDTAGVVLRFENGAIGTLVGSDVAATPWGWDQGTLDDDAFPHDPSSSAYHIAGRVGSLDLPRMERFQYSGAADWHHPLDKSKVVIGQGDSYTRQLRHFAEVVRNEGPPITTVHDAVRTLEVAQAALASALDGTTHALPIGDRQVRQ